MTTDDVLEGMGFEVVTASGLRRDSIAEWQTLFECAWDDGDPAPAWLEKLPHKEGFVAIEARQGERLVGARLAYPWPPRYRTFSENWESGAHYTQLTLVAPEVRRQGLATRLLRLHRDWATRNGFTSLVTQNAALRPAIVAFNLRAGFVVDHRETKDGREQLWMSQRL